MIKDKLTNAETYYGLSEGIKLGFEWLKSQDLENITPGKYYIEGEKIYANIQEYETKDDADYEAHRKYADIQYMIKGREFAGAVDINKCKPCTEYDGEKDIEFLKYAGEEFYQVLNEGEFLIFYPQDAHKPSINPGHKQLVKKVVVKVRLG